MEKPAELQDWHEFIRIRQWVTMIAVEHDVWRKLYRDKEYFQLLKSEVPHTASWLPGSLLRSMTVGLSALYDAKSQGRHENLVMWSLFDQAKPWLGCAAVVDLATTEERIRASVEIFKQFRHKALAHHDLPVSLGKAPLDTPTADNIQELVSLTVDVLNFLSVQLYDTTTLFAQRAPHDLLHALRRSQRFKSLQK
jgi:hypothetical protein